MIAKPKRYNIRIVIEPQGAGWDEACQASITLGDIPRESIIRSDYPAQVRKAVRVFEDTLGFDLTDFPACGDRHTT